MNEDDNAKIISLLETNNKLLQEGIVLTKRLIALFEKYDADVFEAEELQRETQNSRPQRSSRRAGNSG